MKYLNIIWVITLISCSHSQNQTESLEQEEQISKVIFSDSTEFIQSSEFITLAKRIFDQSDREREVNGALIKQLSQDVLNFTSSKSYSIQEKLDLLFIIKFYQRALFRDIRSKVDYHIKNSDSLILSDPVLLMPFIACSFCDASIFNFYCLYDFDNLPQFYQDIYENIIESKNKPLAELELVMLSETRRIIYSEKFIARTKISPASQ